MKKKANIIDENRLGEKTANNMQDKAKLFNYYFQSVHLQPTSLETILPPRRKL